MTARSAWEFHPIERVVATSLEEAPGSTFSVRVLDALGNAYLLDERGRLVERTSADVAPRLATRLPWGGWGALTDAWLVAIDDAGQVPWHLPAERWTVLAAGARGLAVGDADGVVRVLSPSGRERSRHATGHHLQGLSLASADGHLVAIGSSGHVSVYDGEHLAWATNLRLNLTTIAGSASGFFAVVAGLDGVQVMHVGGSVLGDYAPGPRVVDAALSADGSRLLMSDADGVLYLLELPSGDCTWHETRSLHQGGLRLGRHGKEALTVAAASSIELLAFEPLAGSTERRTLELSGRPAPAGLWRIPHASFELAEGARFDVAPGGECIAVADTTRFSVTLLDRRGHPTSVERELGECSRLAFSADGSSLLVLAGEALTLLDRHGGPRARLRGRFVQGVVGAHGWIAAVAGMPPTLLLAQGERIAWQVALPTDPLQVCVSAGEALLAAACRDGSLSCHGPDGGLRWRIAHSAREGSMAGTLDGFVLADAGGLAGVSPAGTIAWRAATPSPLELTMLGDRLFAHEAHERFWEVLPGGALSRIDAAQNLGRSRLAVTAAGEIREVNVNGSTLTCFDLEGNLRWRCEAPEAIAASELACAGGLLAFRAGALLHLIDLDASGRDEPSRASFLEV